MLSVVAVRQERKHSQTCDIATYGSLSLTVIFKSFEMTILGIFPRSRIAHSSSGLTWTIAHLHPSLVCTVS